MNKLKNIILILILCGFCESGFSQSYFYSQKLQKIYNNLSVSCMNKTFFAHARTDTTILCTEIAKTDTIPIIISIDKYGIIEHIGYQFFVGIDTIYDRNIIRFMEREFLNLLTTKELNEVLVENYEDRLDITLNGNSIGSNFFKNKTNLLKLLRNVTGFSVKRVENFYRVDVDCRSSLAHNNSVQSTLSFQFPADYELIYGMNKKEMDNFISFNLQNHKCKQSINEMENCVDMVYFHDSVYVCKGNSFMISQINNDLYYTVNDISSNLIFNQAMPTESFSNVMLFSSEKNYTIKVKQRKYGNINDKYTICSKDFFDFFDKNYDKYFGIEPAKDGILKGTLIFKDRSTNTIHLAYIEISVEALMHGGEMNMTLTANIPQHNLENLYGEK